MKLKCEIILPDNADYKTKLDAMAKAGRYDESYLSLKDIAERYPDVTVVLHDSFLDGEVFSYGNYNKGEWVQYGSTRGFA